MKFASRCLSVIVVVALCGQLALAQGTTEGRKTSGPRKQLVKIIFAGLGGAVLGLSTLNFYGRPQEHLNNIGIGLAIGIIAGTIYTTYETANPKKDTEAQALPLPPAPTVRPDPQVTLLQMRWEFE